MKERHRLYRKHLSFYLLVTVMITVSSSPFFWKCRQYNLHSAVGSGNSSRLPVVHLVYLHPPIHCSAGGAGSQTTMLKH